MQERKNKLLTLSLITLMLITSGAFYVVNRDERPLVDASIFKVEALETIDSVVLESPGGNSTLEYDGTRWMVNDRYRADAQMIDVFFATLAQVVPKRPVSENMTDSISSALREGGVRVLLYAVDELRKEFFVGGNTQKNETYFLSTTEGPFVMTIPGYRVYAAGVFELDEDGWRDKQVFRFNQRNFKKLTTTFGKDPGQGFVISYDDQVFEIGGLQDPDTTKIFDYLDGVAVLKAETFYRQGEMTWVDSLLAVQPSFDVEVTDTQGRTSKLIIYPPLAREAQVVGKMGEESALFQKKDIVRIAKKKSYFQKMP